MMAARTTEKLESTDTAVTSSSQPSYREGEYVAVYDYEAEEADELDVEFGDILINVEDTSDGWVEIFRQKIGRNNLHRPFGIDPCGS